MARFHIRETFAIQDKPTFVLAGFVIEGEVKAGMAVGIPFNANAKMTAKIDRIELIRRPDGDVVCLCFDCLVRDELTLWEALKIKNHSIEITPAA
jgi:hypothetical protein